MVLLCFYGVMALWYYTERAKNTHVINILACFLITLFFWGLRGFCFYDWVSYYPMYLHLDTSNLLSNFSDMEPGFCLLMTICKLIWNNYVFFTFTCSLLNLLLLSIFLLKHVDNYPQGLAFCTVFGCFLLFTDLMRNALAIFIFINSLDYLRDRKAVKYFSLVILSITFHYSAVLYIPLYFFANKKTSKYTFATIFFIGVIIYVLKISIFANIASLILGNVNEYMEERVHVYLEESLSKSPGINIVFIEQMITGVLTLCYMDKLRSLRRDANIYINCILIFFSMSFFLHEFVTLSGRLALLFSVGYWIIWSDLLKCISIRNNRRCFLIFICMYCFLRILGHTRNPMALYENVMLEHESFQQRELLFNLNFHGN